MVIQRRGPACGSERVGYSKSTSLVAGQPIRRLLARLGWRALPVHDFRKFPIPFAAVATDLDTGEAHLLDHGSLPTALRASMSLPGVFAPVVIDGRVLVDGGVARNLPSTKFPPFEVNADSRVTARLRSLNRAAIEDFLTWRRGLRELCALWAQVAWRVVFQLVMFHRQARRASPGALVDMAVGFAAVLAELSAGNRGA